MRTASPSYSNIINLLNLVRSEADINEIEDALKVDPVISYRLMTKINSAGMGFPREVRSLRQAITIFGYHGLYRWLAMLLVTGDPQNGKSIIGRMAIVRGRLLELIGKSPGDSKRGDDLFVVGSFSLLDNILGEPLEKLLNDLSITYVMRQALLSRDGPYGLYLLLVEALELGDETQVERFCSMLEIERQQVAEMHTAAGEWADTMLAG
jgi:EAL and modified HD-GYP domain-containing signal transduction protein